MPIAQKLRKADKKLHNRSAADFIPIACHYNENSLLTKNGELLQIIQINGINAEHISQKLLKLREVLNTAIKNNVPLDGKVAFWLHTVRRKTNLDDLTSYNKLFSANLHNVWKEKNYWHDKFVNTLYISIIYTADKIKLNDISTLINSIFYNKVIDSHHDYLEKAFLKLNDIADKILNYLEEFGAHKLGISYEGEESFSDMIFLYRRIVRLNEDRCLVPIGDLSTYIATDSYAVGGDKIEVIDNNEKKFTAVLSIKEYHESSSAALDKFLQLPIELIATEIFYFVDRKHVIPVFKEQSNFLRISADDGLAEAKGLTEIMGNDPDTRYCNQQIMISIIGDTIEKLELAIANASTTLSEIGIVHVREDINLEQTFWAQLPGNFSFLRRMNPTTLRNITALASLHNFPTGQQYSVWGRSITLLRTESGTPYFMNFHTTENRGNTGIFGSKRTGKTVLTNFLISESTKYNPSILYLSTNSDSEIFINALEGKWIEAEKSIINPFLLEDNIDNKLFAYEFLKIISNHYINPLTQEDLKFLEQLVAKIFLLKPQDRILSKILKKQNLFNKKGENVKIRLNVFAENELYKGMFDKDENPEFVSSGILGVNLYKFTDEYYRTQYFPQDKKLIDKFNEELLLNSSVRAGIIYALFYYHNKIDSEPKILVFDEALSLLQMQNFSSLINEIYYDTAQNNGIVVSTFSLELLLEQELELCNLWLELIDTTIILAINGKLGELKQKLQLTQFEIDKLASISPGSRLFLVKQEGQSILAELSIGAMRGFTRILAGKAEELAIYNRILKEHQGDINQWLTPLYQALEEK